MATIKLKLTQMAHGGSAIGRRQKSGLVFVPYAIPGEQVEVTITKDKGSYAEARVEKILRPSPSRVKARCKHFGTCGGCHFQHITYEKQLELKRELVRDQLERIGKLKNVAVAPTLAHPDPWAYQEDVALSPTKDGRLGFWSPHAHRVIPIEECHVISPRLQSLWQEDIDLSLPGLRKLTLRLGLEDEVLAALEVDDVEPPELEADFPVSVAIVLPDKTAASLIGNPVIDKQAKGRVFRVSPGCYFAPSTTAASMIIDAVLDYAQLSGTETVLEGYSGVGTLTAFLAQQAREVTSVEINENAIEDMAVNLDDCDNVTLYHGWFEEVAPLLEVVPDLAVINPPQSGLTPNASRALLAKKPKKMIYVSSDIATLARDGKHLARGGYRLTAVQPIDALPQTFQITAVSLWERR
ncbi:MAG: class I SAM-dependent RNA methyltransferase [Chloroflexota bacterium]